MQKVSQKTLDSLCSWSKYITLFLVVCQVGYFCRMATGGFTIQGIHSPLSFQEEFATSMSQTQENDLRKILSQKFSYLGKGAQCYAFVSEDGEYVLKFIRFGRLLPPPLVSFLPQSHFLAKKIEHKKGRLFRHLSSFKIAYDDLAKETGLLFVHLNKTENLRTKITLIDPLQIAHTLDLDKVEFILQKKADDLCSILIQCIQEKKRENAKQLLCSLIQVLVQRCQKGIFDADPNIMTNFGAVDGEVIEFDIGRFSKDENEKQPRVYKEEIMRITEEFQTWLKAADPELENFFTQKLREIS